MVSPHFGNTLFTGELKDFLKALTPPDNGGKNEKGRVVTPQSVSILFKASFISGAVLL